MRGEQSDFAELFRLDADGLYRFALMRLRDPSEAEDAVQDAFVRLYRRADDPREFQSPRAWMFSVLASVCVDRRRALNRRGKIFAVGVVDPERHADTSGASGETIASTQEALRGAMAALRRLPVVDGEALSLVAIEGMSYAEVSEITGAPVGTVRSRVSRARQALRRMRDASEDPDSGDGVVVPLPRGGRDGRER